MTESQGTSKSDYHQIRIADLSALYFDGLAAAEVAGAFARDVVSTTRGHPYPLLGDPWQAIQRADYLFGFYSILELALSTAYIKLDSSAFWKGALNILESEGFEQFFEYRWPLVARLRERLRQHVVPHKLGKGPPASYVEVTPKAAAEVIMFEFLTLDQTLFRPLLGGVLLRALEGVPGGPIDFADVQQLVKDEKGVSELLLSGRDDKNPRSLALWELGSLIDFCGGYHKLLRSIPQPILKARAEEHYWAWFGRSHEFGVNLLDLIDQLHKAAVITEEIRLEGTVRSYWLRVYDVVLSLMPGVAKLRAAGHRSAKKLRAPVRRKPRAKSAARPRTGQ